MENEVCKRLWGVRTQKSRWTIKADTRLGCGRRPRGRRPARPLWGGRAGGVTGYQRRRPGAAGAGAAGAPWAPPAWGASGP